METRSGDELTEEYADTIAEMLRGFEQALTDDDALVIHAAEEGWQVDHDEDAGALSADTVSNLDDLRDQLMTEINERPLDYMTTRNSAGELVSVTLILTVGGPYADVELFANGGDARVSVAWWGSEASRRVWLPSLSEWWTELFPAQA